MRSGGPERIRTSDTRFRNLSHVLIKGLTRRSWCQHVAVSTVAAHWCLTFPRHDSCHDARTCREPDAKQPASVELASLMTLNSRPSSSTPTRRRCWSAGGRWPTRWTRCAPPASRRSPRGQTVSCWTCAPRAGGCPAASGVSRAAGADVAHLPSGCRPTTSVHRARRGRSRCRYRAPLSSSNGVDSTGKFSPDIVI